METPKKVIISESSKTVLEILLHEFQSNDIETIIVQDGIQCIEKVYSEVPDAIITEEWTRLLSGVHVALYLKSSDYVNTIPHILLVSSIESKIRLLSHKIGVDAIFLKEENIEKEIMKFLENHWKQSPISKLAIIEESKTFQLDRIISQFDMILESTFFNQTIIGQLVELSIEINSLSSTIHQILELIRCFFPYDIAVVLLKSEKVVQSYILVTNEIFEKDALDFHSICLEDYFLHFDKLELSLDDSILFGLENRDNFYKLSNQRYKLSSYSHLNLVSNSNVFGTIHFGDFRNNLYSDTIQAPLIRFMKSASPFIENSLSMQIVTNKEQNLRKVFSKFVPSDIIDDLVKRNTTLTLQSGEKRNVAVLFSDIRSFTNLSEINSPEALVKFLNNYFDVMCNIITKHGGTIDKFIGDAILAIFGAPKSYEDNASRAVMAAVEMIHSLPLVDYTNIKLFNKKFSIGIGIHEGDVIIGNIGSKEKFDYTIIGDNVNLASRLESLSKHYKQEIIISDVVYKKVKNDYSNIRELDKVKVKGKDESTTIYGIYINQSRFFDPEIVSNFTKGISMYKIQNWKTALDYFEMIIEKIPDDYIAGLYLKRCREYLVNPPLSWDGSVELDFK